MANDENLKPRQSEYDTLFHDEEGYRFALLGYTTKEIAEALGIGNTTIKRWFKEHPSFWASVNRGRASSDAKVAEGLYKRATGFSITEEKLMVVSVGNFESEVQRHQIVTYFPPDAGAALNWLKNRQPDKWRDKQEVAMSGEITLTMNLDGDSPKATDE